MKYLSKTTYKIFMFLSLALFIFYACSNEPVEDDFLIDNNPSNNDTPAALANATPLSGDLPLEISFNSTKYIDNKRVLNYIWDFKDGTTSKIPDPKHSFKAVGDYNVELTVTDDLGTIRKDSISIRIRDSQNRAPQAKIRANPRSGTLPLKVNFKGSHSRDDNGVTDYHWDFKDGSTSDLADVSHTFETAGIYDVVLTVTDEIGLLDREAIEITVIGDDNEAPLAIASASPLTGVLPLEVSFTGSNSTDDTGVESYSWDFKDGSTSVTADPKHIFETAGTYNVELTVKDSIGLSHKKSITITATETENNAPVAVVSASPLSGIMPLEVSFTGSNSTDDTGVESYSWDFNDGSTSVTADPKHIFETPGTYNVELTVKDAAGLEHKKVVGITVNKPENKAPVAIANASPLSGVAPLQVNFTGSNSTDDNGIVGYYWDIPGNPSSSSNLTHTFNDPGVYNISLTVSDADGLEDTANLTITVDQGSIGSTGEGQIPCSVGGGRANDAGAKIWCWENINVPAGNNGNEPFSNGDLGLSIECNPNQVTNAGDRLRFYLNPTSPSPASWCNNDFNLRAEINNNPWNVDHPAGTEEWFGWSYTFGNDYIIDQVNNWVFYQVHEGTTGTSPLISMQVIGQRSGEISLVNASQSGENNTYIPTGVRPTAGQTVDIVLHIIWGDENNGLLQLWMNGSKVYDQQVRTVRATTNVGGNAKFGIYHSRWRNSTGVQSSAQQGITHIETFMGPLRMIMRRPGDADYRKNSYNQVAPN